MVQWTPASHVPLVHISAVLQQELASDQGALGDTRRQSENTNQVIFRCNNEDKIKYLFPVSQVFKHGKMFFFLMFVSHLVPAADYHSVVRKRNVAT